MGCLGDAGIPPGTCTVTNIVVAPRLSQIVAGATTALTATVSQTNCPPLRITWMSSAPKVATVDGNGVVTGVSAGTVVITASIPDTGSLGVHSGTAVVTVAGGPLLAVTMISPNAGAMNVAIDSLIRVRFSAPIDSTTTTAATIRVTTGDFVVAGTFFVDSNLVVFKPTLPLTEFNTGYTVTVTMGVLSVAGDFLPIPMVWTFTTVFWDPAYTYRLTNQFFGDTASLDTHTGDLTCFMGASASSPSQSWYFIPAPDQAGFYIAHNLLGADTTDLQGNMAPARCALVAPAPATGQLWRPIVFGPAFPRGYRLQTLELGDAQSLDAQIVAGEGAPMMLPNSEATSQVWHFARIAHR